MFKYYLFILVLGIITAVSIIAGIQITGSPFMQKDINSDLAKYRSINNIKSAIDNYFIVNNSLPNSLDELNLYSGLEEGNIKKSFTYQENGLIQYKLCSNFALDTTNKTNKEIFDTNLGLLNNNVPTLHKKGLDCLSLAIPDSFKNENNSYLFEKYTQTSPEKILSGLKFSNIDLSNTKVSDVYLTKGKVGSAAIFFGNDKSYIDIKSFDHNIFSGDFTLSFWTYRLDSGSRAIISNTNNIDGGFGVFVGNEGEIYCRTSDGVSYVDSYTDYYGKYLVARNGWHNITIVRKKSGCQIYIDGLDKTTTKGVHTMIAENSNPLTLGGLPSHKYEMYRGYIEEVKLSNFAMTPNQVLNELNSFTN